MIRRSRWRIALEVVAILIGSVGIGAAIVELVT